jgi:hypothetical protein
MTINAEKKLRRMFELCELSKRLYIARLKKERPGLGEEAYARMYRNHVLSRKDAEGRRYA